MISVGETKLKPPSFSTYESAKKADYSEEYESPEEFGKLLFGGKQMKVKIEYAEIEWKGRILRSSSTLYKRREEINSHSKEQKKNIREDGLEDNNVAKPKFLAFKNLPCCLVKKVYRVYTEGKTKLDEYTEDASFALLFNSGTDGTKKSRVGHPLPSQAQLLFDPKVCESKFEFDFTRPISYILGNTTETGDASKDRQILCGWLISQLFPFKFSFINKKGKKPLRERKYC